MRLQREARVSIPNDIGVETPQGLRRGSSVYWIIARNKSALSPTGQASEWQVSGEAVAVDLPGGQTLLALLRTSAIHDDLAGLSMSAPDPSFATIWSKAPHALRTGRATAKIAVADRRFEICVDGSEAGPEFLPS